MGKRGFQGIDPLTVQQGAIRWSYILLALRNGVFGATVPRNYAISPSRLDVCLGDTEVKGWAKECEKNNWLFFPPLKPDKQTWDNLVAAKSKQEMKMTARRFAAWASRAKKRRSMQRGGFAWKAIHGLSVITIPNVSKNECELLRKKTEEFLESKKIWAYPSRTTDRSDYKRLEFFSKILAGIELGLSPTTTVHKLIGWDAIGERLRKMGAYNQRAMRRRRKS